MRPSRSPMGSTPAHATSPAAMRVSRPAGVIVGDAGGEDGGLDERGGEGRALQIFDGVEQRVKIGTMTCAGPDGAA